MEKPLFKKLTYSIKEAKEMGLIVDNNFCWNCQRVMPNKSYLTENGCRWCDTKYYLNGDKNG